MDATEFRNLDHVAGEMRHKSLISTEVIRVKSPVQEDKKAEVLSSDEGLTLETSTRLIHTKLNFLCFVFLFQKYKIPKSDIEETKLNTNDTTVAIKIGNPVKNVNKEVISLVTSPIRR